jgi:molecular chaperone HtpG
LKSNIQVQKDKIQLYSNQVFITDSVENIVPEFLTLLHGVIDSPDIPLNVSRSYLQADSNVKKISSHITKKVADKLNSMFKENREDFESKWDDIKVFIEYGMLTDEKFFDRIEKNFLLKSTDGSYRTFEEYKDAIKEKQTDKDGNLVVLYTNNIDEQDAFIQQAKNREYDVLLMDSPLTSHLIQQLETKWENTKFTRVDADTVDKLIQKEENIESNLTEDQQKELQPVIESVVNKEQFTVQFESLNENDEPMMITRPEFMRRMKEQQEVGGGGGMFGMGNMPDMFNLVVNSNHPLISKILMEESEDKKKALAKQAADLAKLSQNMLKGKELTEFIKRSVTLID